MSVARVRPAVASGTVVAPPSKSYTHRALVVGHLARRPFTVEHPLEADDTRATARAIGTLGTPVRRERDVWRIEPGARSRRPRRRQIDCSESGTTLRFVSALAALSADEFEITGSPRLSERPLAPLLGALRSLGANCSTPSVRRSLPLRIRGPIDGGHLRLDASESSQFASALLLALPTVPHNSRIDLSGPIVSEPYLDATRAVLRAQGVTVRGDRRTLRVPGRQSYSGTRFQVPGDASSAAYFWAAAAVTGGSVRVDRAGLEWPQADLAILPLLRRAGARVQRSTDAVRVDGGRLRPFTADLTRSPDLYPLVGVVAAVTRGRSRLRGAPHVALKESDRRGGTRRLATALGARVREVPGGLDIEGTGRVRPLALAGETDHRMVMSAAVGALRGSGTSRIANAEAVAKSFPGFFAALEKISEEATGP